MKEAIIEIINTQGFINVNHFGERAERRVRQILSELRKEGFITVPMNNNWTYYHADKVDQASLRAYYKQQKAHWKSQYFNTILPIARKVKDVKLQELMGGMSEIQDEV